jgi:TolA-binding protein
MSRSSMDWKAGTVTATRLSTYPSSSHTEVAKYWIADMNFMSQEAEEPAVWMASPMFSV